MHASCVVLGENGVLVLGVSGSGKSTLARLLVEAARRDGGFARLVGDDAVTVTAANGRLVARPHPAVAGLHEMRGLGLRAVAHEPAVVVRLVVEIGEAAERLPEPDALATTLVGVTVPRVRATTPEAALPLVLAALDVAHGLPPAERMG